MATSWAFTQTTPWTERSSKHEYIVAGFMTRQRSLSLRQLGAKM